MKFSKRFILLGSEFIYYLFFQIIFSLIVTNLKGQCSTSLASDIAPGNFSSNPQELVVYNNKLYFTADIAVNGRELWSYDGTTATLASDVASGTFSSNPQKLVVYNNKLYFTADIAVNGRELWSYDGTTATLASDVAPGNFSSNPQELVVYNNKLYFTADIAVNGRELWSYDGTTATLASDVAPGNFSSNPQKLVVYNNKLYFTADVAVNGRELWSYDGTTATLASDVAPGNFSSNPQELVAYNNKLYFTADIAVNGRELWSYDGTTATLASDVAPGNFSSNPQELVVYNNKLYFTADIAVNGRELWSYDGTTATLASDVAPGTFSSNPQKLVVYNNKLYFTADIAVNGRELWSYDGTTATLASDVAPGNFSSNPQELVVYNNKLYFTADIAVNGRELYVFIDPVYCAAAISGAMASQSATVIPTVTLNYSGATSGSIVTGIDGQYTLPVDIGDSYTITPSKNNDQVKTNGVTTLDITLIRRHILGSALLNSPYKIIAGDVNSSNSLTSLDIAVLRKLILGSDTTFNGKLWSFVPADFVFNNPLVPFPYDNFKNFTNITTSQPDINFIGMKLGDVNNNWDPNTLKMGAVGEVQFAMDEYQTLPGDEIIVPVRVKDFNAIAGYQFTLTWNHEVIELLEVVNQSIPGYYGEQSIRNGILTTSWNDGAGAAVSLNDDAVAFELKFKVIGALGSSTEIKIGSELTASEAYTNDLDLLDIAATHGNVKVGEVISSLITPPSTLNTQLSVQPNPFSNFTNIIFTLSQEEYVRIEIYDVLGKVVKTFEGNFKSGEHQLQWNGDDNSNSSLAKGLYHVKMVAGKSVMGEKVLLLR